MRQPVNIKKTNYTKSPLPKEVIVKLSNALSFYANRSFQGWVTRAHELGKPITNCK